MKMTLLACSMKCRRNRFITWWRLIFFGPDPVEGIEGFLHGEAGEADAPGDGAVAAPGGLAFQQSGEQGQVVPLLLRGGLHELGIVFAHEGAYSTAK